MVGSLGGLHEGERVRLIGRPAHSAKHGAQFRVEAGYPLLPHTASGIRAYLAGGRVPGIGSGLAERLVARFGADTLRVIEHEPDRLAEVGGIGANRDNPGRYWYANLMMGVNVLEQARIHSTEKVELLEPTSSRDTSTCFSTETRSRIWQ